MTEKSPAEEQDNDLGAVITNFCHDIDSLREMLSSTMFMIIAAEKREGEKFDDFANRFGERIASEAGIPKYRFTRDYVAKATRLTRRYHRVSRGFVLVPRSFIVSLVSSFDALIGVLLSALYAKRPELLDATERSLSLAEIKNLGSIEAAADFLVGKEIETLLRQSYAEQFTAMEKRFSIKLREGLSAWPRFIELTQRRNCFVHSGGVASEQYLKVCREHQAELDPHLSAGDVLDVNPDYFLRAHACVFEIGVKLCQVLWRKLLPAEIAAADSNLTTIIFDLLLEGRWELACNLSDFACLTLKRHFDERNRLVFRVNQAQAYKWSGNEKKSIEILDGEDWSARSEDFQIAQQVLRDDFEAAADTMRRIGADGAISETAYSEWPLFRKFRESSQFSTAFREIFKRDFVDLEKILSAEEEQKVRRFLDHVKKLWEEEEEGTNPSNPAYIDVDLN